MINPNSAAPEKANPASNILEIADRKDLGDDVFTNVYEQWLPPAARGIYGGAVIALSLAAAQKTLPSDFHIHSCQCTFLRAGSVDSRQTFHVARVRQGFTFATRTVECRQQGETIFIITVSFTRESERISRTVQHTVAPFEVPEPPGELCEERPEWTLTEPFQRRTIDVIDELASNNSPHNRRILRQWFRFPGVIPETGGPGAHLHALAFLTDGYFILTAARLHRLWRLPFALEDVPSLPPKLRSQVQRVNESEGLGSTIEEWAKRPRMSMATSLDHRIYFHEPLRTKADEWMVSEMESPWAAHGRALVVQRIFSKDGTLLATCSQEVRLFQ
ncbi:Acyl-coenzyme A thioesterase 8 [Fusarium oxysporum f. sp. rapae]|uniref:Acyl-coenzyme A thioesterase 8 n=1 Tax=Fusarium oxysporum f. sp. rapae TaxID=485398 RepID=A0A8J5NTR1_FUSOX|nr:Acyl-coenzyme A thioesterase 8 [Fusarium oxysporum f. sp. rapae]